MYTFSETKKMFKVLMKDFKDLRNDLNKLTKI